MELVLTGSQVLTVLGATSLWFVIAIIITRHLLHRKKRGDNMYSVPIEKKYQTIDVLKNRVTSLGIASALSIGSAVVLMSWTSYEHSSSFIIIDTLPVADEVVPPITFQKPITPPPPTVPPIIEVVDTDILDEPDFEPLEIDDDIPYEAPPTAIIEKQQVFTPPPPPDPVNDEPEIYPIAEQMPLFGGCEDRACSDRKLLSYLSSEVRYPPQARDNDIEGRVYVRFVVEKDGSVGGITILRGVGAGCDKEVIRVIEKMNELKTTWKPGKQRGVKVRVMYTLPVTFKINQ